MSRPVSASGQVKKTADQVRDDMESFWKEHSQHASEEEMMLDSNAEVLGKEEIPEILGLLPDVTGLDVLELGAGIGRFTGHLAEKARSVTAVDFMEVFVDKNRQLNGHHKNASFIQADVTRLELPKESYDMIFSNWLLMYLEEHEVHALFTSLLSWLRPGGYFFFRESCFHQSGNQSRSSNPTKYRDPATYNLLLQSAFVPIVGPTLNGSNGDGTNGTAEEHIKKGVEQNAVPPVHSENGVKQNGVAVIETKECTGEQEGQGGASSSYVFEIIMCKSVQTYIKLKSNRNQLCWLLYKVERSDFHGYRSFQEFLDKHQYSLSSILNYEWIFGKNFVSPGGLETTKEFSKMLTLQPGESVLDLGCGIGGSAFHIAQTYDVLVTGMDLSANMVALALERANEFKDNRVQFELGDATKRDFPAESFDAIYSRDTILHIKDKRTLFSSCIRWLKPGGRLVITDYCCRDDPESTWSVQFQEYVRNRGYHLLSIPDYEQLLQDVGFKAVVAVDRTDLFVDILRGELTRIENRAQKLDVIKEVTLNDSASLTSSWKDKLSQCASGDHKYASFYAEKQ